MIEVKDLRKTYTRGATQVEALRGVSLSVPTGQFMSIMGPSGSGKSTLLNLVGALDQASSGQLLIDGKEIGKLADTSPSSAAIASASSSSSSTCSRPSRRWRT